jgi:hypothetical protein
MQAITWSNKQLPADLPDRHVATAVTLVFLVHIFKEKWYFSLGIVKSSRWGEFFGQGDEIVVRTHNSFMNAVRL